MKLSQNAESKLTYLILDFMGNTVQVSLLNMLFSVVF